MGSVLVQAARFLQEFKAVLCSDAHVQKLAEQLIGAGLHWQAAKRARGIMVELEDAKLAGRDYDVGLLVALRQVPHMLQVSDSRW